MNRIFWIDNRLNESLTYEELLDYIGDPAPVIINYRTNSVRKFLLNLVKAIVYSIDIELPDLHFSEAVQSIANPEGYTPAGSAITEKVALKSVEELTHRLVKSTSLLKIYTSGTTGQPKAVLHTIHTLTREVRTGSKYEDNVWAFAYNPTHIAGLQVVFQALMNGNRLVNVFGYSREQIYSTLKKEAVTHVSATPTFYRTLLPVDECLPLVERVSLGGERSTADLHSKLLPLFPGARINNIYASTEAGTLLASSGESFFIPEDRQHLIKIENSSLLIHRSILSVSLQASQNDDWYDSGDVVAFVEGSSKFFAFVSRKNEMINTGGNKVNPAEVEDVIKAQSGIRDAHVYGKKNSILGNIIVADIAVEKIEDWDETLFRKKLSLILHDFKIPRKYNISTTLTHTRTGKIKR